MQEAVAFGRVVSGLLPIPAIEGMAALASLQFARPAYATTKVGLVTSQADQAIRADVVRANFGVDGTGVTVGVLSDSFNCLGGATADFAPAPFSRIVPSRQPPVPPASLGVRRTTLTRGQAKTFSNASRFPPALDSPSPSNGIHRLLPSAPAVAAPPTISISMCSMTRQRPSCSAVHLPILGGTRWRSSASSTPPGRR